MTTATKPSLPAKLAEVMAAVGRIEKKGTNEAQNYKFVRDADVMDAIRKELSARNVAVVVCVDDQTLTPSGTTRAGNPTFLTSVSGSVEFHDGDSDAVIIASGQGQGADSGDKGIYKAVTGMVKQTLLKTFLVPTGDDPENEREDERAEAQQARVGLTDLQRQNLKNQMQKAGLAGPQQVAFLVQEIGKGTTAEMTTDDLNKVLLALESAEKVAAVIADVKPAVPAE